MIGPHFYYDLLRLPRKGWSTFFRCLYLVILLIGLAIMWEGNRDSIHDPAGYARFAHEFATTLIIMQDVLILFFLPVYVASAISEERENQTLDALFISPLTDWQIIWGKFASRLMHLGAVILAGVPLLAFMHMWGNVAVSILVYHFLHTILLAITLSSICIMVSAQKPAVFQAVITSYPIVLGLGLIGTLLSFALPEIFAIFLRGFAFINDGAPAYWFSLSLIAPCYIWITVTFLRFARLGVRRLRYLETAPVRKTTSSFALADTRDPMVHVRKGKVIGSYIHHLALPIRGGAMFWKECLKDGTKWSLTCRWVIAPIVLIAMLSIFLQLPAPRSLNGRYEPVELRAILSPFAYTPYFIAIAAYFLVVIFQTTQSVAGEREQNTLEFLLLIPASRREILFCKWLGPLWKNWPLLAVAYLGVFFGMGASVFSPLTGLVLLLLPWPFLLMVSFLGLCLSVICRRALYANIVMTGYLLLLIAGHIIGSDWLTGLFPAYSYLIFEQTSNGLYNFEYRQGLPLVFAEQASFLVLAGIFGWLAFMKFRRTDYQAKM